MITRQPPDTTRPPSASTRRSHLAPRPLLIAGGLVAGLAIAFAMPARAATPAELLAGYTAEAAAPASAERGQRFFTSVQGREWSCSSCHGKLPVGTGRHAATGKPIGALAPAANAERFSDAAKAEKWFRRNCNDVVGRACSAGEKADVLAWLMTLKP